MFAQLFAKNFGSTNFCANIFANICANFWEKNICANICGQICKKINANFLWILPRLIRNFIDTQACKSFNIYVISTKGKVKHFKMTFSS